MKSKLFVLLVSLSAGSNISAMEKGPSPEEGQALSKSTQFILNCWLKSSLTARPGWKEKFLKAQPESLQFGSYTSDGVEINFLVDKAADGVRFDPRIHDKNDIVVNITSIFERTNPALNKEHGFDEAFKQGLKKHNEKHNHKDKMHNRRDVLTSVDKWTECGYQPYIYETHDEKYKCVTKMPFHQFIDEIKKAEQKEQK